MPPTHAQVRQIPAIGGPHRVAPDQVDENGHLNTGHYFDLCTASATVVFGELGLSFRHNTDRGSGLFSVAQHLEYYAECLLDDELSTRTVLLNRTSKVLHGQTYLVNETRRTVSHTSEFVSLYVDLATRRPTEFLPDIVTGIDSRLDLLRRLTWTPVAPGTLFRG